MHHIDDTHALLRIGPVQARFPVAIAFPSALAQDSSWQLRQPQHREAGLVPIPLAQQGGLHTQPSPRAWRKLWRLVSPAARFVANRVLVLGEPRMGHQAVQATSAVEAAQWWNLWTLLAGWYGRPCSETFLPSSLLQQARSKRWTA